MHSAWMPRASNQRLVMFGYLVATERWLTAADAGARAGLRQRVEPEVMSSVTLSHMIGGQAVAVGHGDLSRSGAGRTRGGDRLQHRRSRGAGLAPGRADGGEATPETPALPVGGALAASSLSGTAAARPAPHVRGPGADPEA